MEMDILLKPGDPNRQPLLSVGVPCLTNALVHLYSFSALKNQGAIDLDDYNLCMTTGRKPYIIAHAVELPTHLVRLRVGLRKSWIGPSKTFTMSLLKDQAICSFTPLAVRKSITQAWMTSYTPLAVRWLVSVILREVLYFNNCYINVRQIRLSERRTILNHKHL